MTGLIVSCMEFLPKLNVVIELLHPDAQAPRKANPSDACFDLRASRQTVVPQGGTGLVDLGWAMQLEEGWEATVRGRSGLASRGILVHHGTIDHLYRLEVKVILHNFSGQEFRVEIGDRIAQMTFAPIYPTAIVLGKVEETERGGFGSTGMR